MPLRHRHRPPLRHLRCRRRWRPLPRRPWHRHRQRLQRRLPRCLPSPPRRSRWPTALETWRATKLPLRHLSARLGQAQGSLPSVTTRSGTSGTRGLHRTRVPLGTQCRPGTPRTGSCSRSPQGDQEWLIHGDLRQHIWCRLERVNASGLWTCLQVGHSALTVSWTRSARTPPWRGHPATHPSAPIGRGSLPLSMRSSASSSAFASDPGLARP